MYFRDIESNAGAKRERDANLKAAAAERLAKNAKNRLPRSKKDK